MIIINTREFRQKLAFFLSQAEKEDIYVRRTKGRLIRIEPCTVDTVFGQKKRKVSSQ